MQLSNEDGSMITLIEWCNGYGTHLVAQIVQDESIVYVVTWQATVTDDRICIIPETRDCLDMREGWPYLMEDGTINEGVLAFYAVAGRENNLVPRRSNGLDEIAGD
jgi:hypothetical protein